jgi:hypothetical protein
MFFYAHILLYGVFYRGDVWWRRRFVEETFCGGDVLWRRRFVEETFCGGDVLWRRRFVGAMTLRP